MGVVGVAHHEGAQRPELGLGLAYDALVGVKHRRTLCRAAQARMAGVLLADRLSQDDVDRGAVWAGGPDRLKGREGVVAAFAADHAPQLVVAQGIAAVEVPNAVGTVIGRRQPVRACAAGPAGAVAWADRQRPELVEGETAVRESAGHLLDPIQLDVLVRIFGLLPSPRALEGDSVRAQDLPQPFPADLHHPDRVVGQVVGELADAPMGERAPQLDRACGGRRDDELLVVTADQVGTASRPLRVERRNPRSLKAWITSRTVSSCAATSRAIAGTVVPDADAMMINARRTRTDSCLPRRTIC